jgi:hypothetical protein
MGWGVTKAVVGQVSVAVLIDKFVSATALINFEEVERALRERKAKQVRSIQHFIPCGLCHGPAATPIL